MGNEKEITTLGGGCFWCLEAVFDEVNGVESVESGYAGGWVPNPGYKLVCTGTTGHAEVTQITFDPKVIAFEDILKVFFTIHNPTTLNRQGADVGSQYRSVVFYHSEEQRKIAEKVIKELSVEKLWPDPIITEVTPLKKFYAAEDYHKDYYVNNLDQPYCMAVVAPKVAKFRKLFLDKVKVQV